MKILRQEARIFGFRFVLKAAGILCVIQDFYKQKLDQKNRFTGQDLN